ncbi:hypothetical protein AYK24_10730 [Thermoplasmatales archaeon SG8-52-4]|nr:MAG: hypothetical protein AYK24_10730 [Thermoplasmatales archaeon SG8-52-4]
MKEKIERILKETGNPEEKIEKIASISFDGDQYLVRIPKKISDFLSLKKSSKIQFIVDVSYIEETKRKIMVVKIIDR